MFMSCVTPHQLLFAKIACNTNWAGSHKFRRQPSFCLFDDGDNDVDNDYKNYDELTNLHIFCPPPTRFILSSFGFCAMESRRRYAIMTVLMTIMWMISCWETRTKYPQNVNCRWQTRPDRWLPILSRRPSLDSYHETPFPPTLSQAEKLWIQCNMKV